MQRTVLADRVAQHEIEDAARIVIEFAIAMNGRGDACLEISTDGIFGFAQQSFRISSLDSAYVIFHGQRFPMQEITTASDAVGFALLFQSRMRLEPWGDVPLETRVGIHAGEYLVTEQAGVRRVVGQVADLASRIMSLALGGQILMTRQVFNDARQYVRIDPGFLEGAPPILWIEHGPYQPKGGDIPNRDREESSTARRVRQYQKYLKVNKPVFTIDYCLKPENAKRVYEASRAAGFVRCGPSGSSGDGRGSGVRPDASVAPTMGRPPPGSAPLAPQPPSARSRASALVRCASAKSLGEVLRNWV